MLWIVLASVLGSIGAAFLKAGAIRLELTIPKLISNWRLAAGILFYLASSVPFVKGMQQGELSVLYPLVSLGYIWTMILSRILYEEKITPNKLAAIGFILVGLICLTREGRPRTSTTATATASSVSVPASQH